MGGGRMGCLGSRGAGTNPPLPGKLPPDRLAGDGDHDSFPRGSLVVPAHVSASSLTIAPPIHPPPPWSKRPLELLNRALFRARDKAGQRACVDPPFAI